MSISFSSERLAFKTLEIGDVSDQYVQWLNDPEINRFLEIRFTPQTKCSCEAFVMTMKADSGNYLFGIYNKDNNKHIGNIKLGFINANHQKAQISFLIGEKNYWGKGFATESINRVTQWGFESLGLERNEAGCYEENLAAVRSFLKSGYVVEGFQRGGFEFNGYRVGCFLVAKLRGDSLRQINV